MGAFLEHPLVRELLSLDLPATDYVICGSGALLARGHTVDIGDLDLLARGTAWSTAVRLSGQVRERRHHSGDGVYSMVHLCSERIEVVDAWLPEISTTDGIFETADRYDGLQVMALDLVVATMQVLNRPRDLLHLSALD